jgi:hypothetical protein
MELIEFLKKHWRGEGKLGTAFWFINVVGNLSIKFLLAIILYRLLPTIQSAESVETIKYFVSLFLYSYYSFSLACVWRCSKNTSKEAYSAIAKLYVVLGSFSVAYGLVHPLI